MAWLTHAVPALPPALHAVQAGLVAVTQERDELAKKLYWAVLARDQQGAAKALAARDAIAARQALTEATLKSKAAPASPAGPLGGAGGAAAAGGQRQLLRSQSSTPRAGQRSTTW